MDGVLRACQTPGCSGEVINVATSERISLNDLFKAVRDIVGGRLEPAYGPTRAGDVRDSQADIEKARRLLGYEPTVSFADGIRKTVDWYRASQAVQAESNRQIGRAHV